MYQPWEGRDDPSVGYYYFSVPFDALVDLPKSYAMKEVSRDYLRLLAHDYNIADIDKLSDIELMTAILNQLPIKWIEKIRVWRENVDPELGVKPSDIINFYSSEPMMEILRKIYKKLPLTPEEINQIRMVNQVIMKSPVPDQPFYVFRGNRTTSFPLDTIINFETPKSGSLGLRWIKQSYYGFYGGRDKDVILRILVPAGSHVLWDKSEDQVIFPSNSRFRVTSLPYKKYSSIGFALFQDVQLL